MSDRAAIRLRDSFQDVVVKMAEGNPGAVTVLMRLLQDDKMLEILGLDDMNIRGTQIWVAWKGWAHEDMETFLNGIKNRSQEMVDAVNAEGARGNHQEVAVCHGASFTR